MLDPEIERIARRNNSNNRHKKLQANLQNLEESYVSKQETMADMDNSNNLNNNNENNINNGNNVGGIPYHNSLRYLAHIVRTSRNICQVQMKTGLLQIIYVNTFAGLDHKDMYTHLTKFYEIFGMLRALDRG